MIRTDFQQFTSSRCLLDLDVRTLKMLCAADSLGVESEEGLLDAIQRWVKHHGNAALEDLMSLVRLEYIRFERLWQMTIQDPVLRQSKTFGAMVEQRLRHALDGASGIVSAPRAGFSAFLIAEAAIKPGNVICHVISSLRSQQLEHNRIQQDLATLSAALEGVTGKSIRLLSMGTSDS